MLMCLLGNASVRLDVWCVQPWGHQMQRRRPVTCANSVSEGGHKPYVHGLCAWSWRCRELFFGQVNREVDRGRSMLPRTSTLLSYGRPRVSRS